MKAAISLMLGLFLAFVLIFWYWLPTPHQLDTRWHAVDLGPDQVDLAGSPVAC